MAELVYSTSTGQRSRKSPHELALSDAVTIFLEPEAGFVTIGGYRLPAHRISDELGEDGQIGYFDLSGKLWDYAIDLYDDHVIVSKQSMVDYGDGTPPSYYSDVGEFMQIRAFARYLVQEVIPDCLVAHLRQETPGPAKIEE